MARKMRKIIIIIFCLLQISSEVFAVELYFQKLRTCEDMEVILNLKKGSIQSMRSYPEDIIVLTLTNTLTSIQKTKLKEVLGVIEKDASILNTLEDGLQ